MPVFSDAPPENYYQWFPEYDSKKYHALNFGHAMCSNKIWISPFHQGGFDATGLPPDADLCFKCKSIGAELVRKMIADQSR